ncbi:MAG TPA: UbiX family flavin prenyltransferase [Bacteroidota bacterium]|nr:UbiX family flavin prenyltransferase [Bacteroidota bacterium]
MRIVVGITGSSGAAFAVDFLKQSSAEKYLVVSKWGKVLLKEELGLSEKDLHKHIKRQFSDDDLTAPIASGSNPVDACVILPCSTSTLGKIASGIGDTLITRAAQIALKERFKLILCIRETPLSSVSLEQSAKLSQSGAIVMPISPPMYFTPKSVEEYISAFTDKLLGVLGERIPRGWRAEELE